MDCRSDRRGLRAHSSYSSTRNGRLGVARNVGLRRLGGVTRLRAAALILGRTLRERTARPHGRRGRQRTQRSVSGEYADDRSTESEAAAADRGLRAGDGGRQPSAARRLQGPSTAPPQATAPSVSPLHQGSPRADLAGFHTNRTLFRTNIRVTFLNTLFWEGYSANLYI